MPKMILKQHNEKTNNLYKMYNHIMSNCILEKKNILNSCQEKLKLLNPQLQLKRGFTITTNMSNKIIYNSKNIAVGEEVKIKLASGKLIANIIDITISLINI